MRFTATHPAPDDSRFAPGCFDSGIGKPITVRLPHRDAVGTMISATVADDGRAVEITIEVDAPEIGEGVIHGISHESLSDRDSRPARTRDEGKPGEA